MQELINTFLFDKAIPNLLSEGCPTDLKIFYNDENKTFSYVYQGEPDLERILTKLDAPLDIVALISVHLPETSDFHFMKFEKLKEFDEDEDDLVQTWGSRINSHVTYLFNNILNEIRNIILTNQKLTFQTPTKLKSNFKNIDQGFKSIDEWQAKIVIGNNIRTPREGEKGLKIGNYDGVGYAMINLDNGFIVPIARSDEHNMGYDLMHHYMDKELIPRGRYYPIHKTNYIYDLSNDERRIESLSAFKLWRKLGGPNYVVQGGSRQKFVMLMDDFIKVEGRITFYKDMGKELYPTGKLLVNSFEKLIEGLNQARNNPRYPVKKLFSIAVNLFTTVKPQFFFKFDLSKALELMDAQLSEAEVNQDVNALEQVLFSHSGLKNLIHIALKEAVESDSMFGKDDMIEIFGNIDFALEEFNRLSSL